MAQASSRSRVVGDYIVGRQIGSGSFSVVWHGRHRVHGTEVAIKEIVTARLNKKLQESLMSEIYILKRINHPNIICLHDMIEVPGRIHLVLEYCKGGDLAVYIQRHGRVLEATAKHFMQQLASGLKVLRDNNLIHRDLKPQNLLLSRNDENAVLKIADFGFARSLQPRGLAETLCGSPLYMAPEIMQLQKYDAKVKFTIFMPWSTNKCLVLLLPVNLKLNTQADLWSVGAILFQLVTGRTPFNGNNQIQLLQNIMKSGELQFPFDNQALSTGCRDLCQKLLRRNPVERLTFEEFFNHPFLSHKQQEQDETIREQRSSKLVDRFPSSEGIPLRSTGESPHEDCLPFFLDDDSTGAVGSPSNLSRKSAMKSTYGFSLDTKLDKADSVSGTAIEKNIPSKYGSAVHRLANAGMQPEIHRPLERNLNDPLTSTDPRLFNTQSRDSAITDSWENIDQDYVLVSGPPMDASSSSFTCKLPCKSERSHQATSSTASTSSAPMPIVAAAASNSCRIGISESQVPSPGTLQGSVDTADALEQPSTDCMTRLKSLQQCACAITELVSEKIEAGKQLEAFSIQLIILAIWKQALHICHTQAASAMEGSPSQESMRYRRSTSNTEECLDVVNAKEPGDILLKIEKRFLMEVEHAEELSKAIEPGNTEMPDAMECIFQSALAFGRHGGVEELMGDMESAAALYSKAVRLLTFLLKEAPSLILNPPFSLTNSDRHRLRTYIHIINNRQDYSRSQRMTFLKCEDKEHTIKNKF